MTESAIVPIVGRATPGRWLSRRSVEVFIAIVIAAISIGMIYPFLWLIFSSFKNGGEIVAIPVQLLPREWTLGAYEMVWTRTNLPQAYANSLIISTAVVVTVLFTSSLGGYVFGRLDFPARNVVFAFILSTTMVPFVTLLIPLYIVVMKLGLVNTYAAVWLPSAVSSFGIFLCRQFIFTLPQDLDDAARIDGAGDFAIYRLVVLPLIRPVLSALAIFTFLGSFNSYLWPLVALSDKALFTLPLILVQVSQTFGGMNYQGVMAGSVLASLPSLFVYIAFQRNFVRGIALSGLKG
jgi:ABC-type glycerol-3-phosphate transport system permease component